MVQGAGRGAGGGGEERARNTKRSAQEKPAGASEERREFVKRNLLAFFEKIRISKEFLIILL
jgi:hypothetical protein